MLEKHWPMRAVYLAMQRMLPRLPIHARISAALGPPGGALQNHAACSLSCTQNRGFSLNRAQALLAVMLSDPTGFKRGFASLTALQRAHLLIIC